MDSYSFTYKDVLKRYERIINKPSKFELRLLATILLIITIVNITSLCFAAENEEVVEYNQIIGIGMSQNSNVFYSSEASSVGYFQAEKGYIYTIQIPDYFQESRIIAYSTDVPSLNGVYTILSSVSPGQSYTYSFNEDTIIYLDFWQYNPNIQVTRHKIASQETAVNDLVENVGISQIWSIFDTSIGFVGVVVVVAFGIFLIFIAIKKVSKGKSDF